MAPRAARPQATRPLTWRHANPSATDIDGARLHPASIRRSSGLSKSLALGGWRTGVARLLPDRYGAATLPATAFGEHPSALRQRLATGLLYGETREQRDAALTATNPLTLPWIANALIWLQEVLTDLREVPSGTPGS